MFGWKELLNLFGFSLAHGLATRDMASAIGVGASVIGGMMSDDASEDAANVQSASAGEALNEIRRIDNRTRRDTNVYRNLGAGSTSKLAYLLGIGPQNFDQYSGLNLVERGADGSIQPNALLYSTDPEYKKWFATLQHRIREGDPTFNQGFADNVNNVEGYAETYLRNHIGGKNTPEQSATAAGGEYGDLTRDFTQDDLNNDVVYNAGLQFGLNEGNKAIERRAAAFGGYDSGATLKALTRFGNDYGETKAAGAFDRFMNNKNSLYNMLMGGAGVGQNAVNTDASSGANFASTASNLMTGAGNAQAAGIVGGANAWNNALGGVANAANTYQTNQVLDRVLRGGGAGGTFGSGGSGMVLY